MAEITLELLMEVSFFKLFKRNVDYTLDKGFLLLIALLSN